MEEETHNGCHSAGIRTIDSLSGDEMNRFRDRGDAGRKLARRLSHYQGRDDVIVLALPRGGLPVGAEVAESLGASMDVFLVRKLGVPGHEELAMGAIASGGVRVVDDRVLSQAQVQADDLARVLAKEDRELRRRERLYRGDRPYPYVTDKVVILVDDGLATGSSVRAAIRGVRGLSPKAIVVGVPVAPPEVCAAIKKDVDEVVCVLRPPMMLGIGGHYERFPQLTDDDVRALLDQVE